ncbi:MAG: tripartite tricarboxylate transporter substrate binding protein [Syntrophales bacterium]|nr:tripartite tricarboxylate transporter substrate binding protein [Syntrophales bacterium]
MKKNRVLLSIVVVFSLFAFVLAISPAQAAFPDKPIRMIVPFPAGGNADIVARSIGNELSKNLGVPVVIENRGGAGGVIGSEVVAKAPADGYTIMMVSASHVINPSMQKSLPYDTIKDFAGISLVAEVPTVLVVHPSVQANSLKELIALAKANPGKINFASAGNGTVGHLAGELLKSMAQIKMEHVAYKGNGPAMTDLLGGHVQMLFSSMPSALPHIKSGMLRALVVTAPKRSAAAPAIPSTTEAGMPGFDVSTGFGLFAPAKTPRAVINKLHAEVVKSLKLPEVRDRLASQGAEPVGSTPEEYDAFVKTESAKWAKVCKEAGIKPE